MAEGRGSVVALVDLGAALVAGALWYVRPELGPLPLLLLAIGLVVRHFSDPPVEYELTALDAAVALFLVSAGIGLLIAYDWNVALEKFYVILGGVGIYGALVRVPAEIDLGGRTVKPVNLLLAVLPTTIAAYYVVTADYTLQIGKLPFLDGVFGWISSWQPVLPGHKLHPNVAGGLIAALLPLQVLALAELAGAETFASGRPQGSPLRPGSAVDRDASVPGAASGGRQRPGIQSGATGGSAGAPGIVSGGRQPVVEGRLEGGGTGASGIPPLRAWEQAKVPSPASQPPYRLGWRWPGIETVLVVISVLGLVLSASRGAWAALVLVAAVWALVSRVWPSQTGPTKAGPNGGKVAAGVTGLVVAGLVAAPGAVAQVGSTLSVAMAREVASTRSVAMAHEVESTLSGTEPAGGVQSKGASFDYGLAPSAQDAKGLVARAASFDAALLGRLAPSGRSAQDALVQRVSFDAAPVARGVVGANLAPAPGLAMAHSSTLQGDRKGRPYTQDDRNASFDAGQDAEPLRGLGAMAPSTAPLRGSAQDAERLRGLGEDAQGAVDGRADLLRNSLALAWDTAFTGIGLGGFQMAFSSYILLLHVGHTYHSHNLFLNVWLEQGLLGLLALIWLLVAAVVAWRRVRRLGDRRGNAWAAAALAAITVIVVHGMVDDAFYGSRAVLLLFVPFSLLTRTQGDAVWSAYEPPTLTQVLVSRNGFIAAGVLAFALLLGLTPPVRSQFQANLGALSQTRAELSVYEWPTWPIQDALRRDTGSGGVPNEAGGAPTPARLSAESASGGTRTTAGASTQTASGGMPGNAGEGAPVNLGPSIGHYERALAIDPKNEVANRRLGQIALSRGDYPTAGVLLTSAYHNDYTNRAARQLYGEWLAIEGQTEKAAKVWQTVDVSSGQLDARVWWYESIGEMEKAAAIRDAAGLTVGG